MKLKIGMPSAEKLTDFFKQYKFVLIVIVVGIILLALPSGESQGSSVTAEGVTGAEEDFSVEALEEKLSDILSKIEGAGKVSVVLTVRSGTERVLAVDRDCAESGEKSEVREETVVISTDAGEEVVLIGQNYPTFQGALVVCPGGDDPKVQLQISQALAALTGLGSNRITVCKGS